MGHNSQYFPDIGEKERHVTCLLTSFQSCEKSKAQASVFHLKIVFDVSIVAFTYFSHLLLMNPCDSGFSHPLLQIEFDAIRADRVRLYLPLVDTPLL